MDQCTIDLLNPIDEDQLFFFKARLAGLENNSRERENVWSEQ